MIDQNLLNIIFGLVASIGGWFARELWTAVKELKTDLSKLREDLPKNYLVKDDYREDMKKIHEMLNKIFDKLDGKVDK